MAKKDKEEQDDFLLPGEEGEDEGQETDEQDDDDSDSDDDGDEDGEEDDDEGQDDDTDKADRAVEWLARILDFANNNESHENPDVAVFAHQVAALAQGEGQGEDDHINLVDFTCHCGSEHDK